jgi:hypothetical protein
VVDRAAGHHSYDAGDSLVALRLLAFPGKEFFERPMSNVGHGRHLACAPMARRMMLIRLPAIRRG